MRTGSAVTADLSSKAARLRARCESEVESHGGDPVSEVDAPHGIPGGRESDPRERGGRDAYRVGPRRNACERRGGDRSGRLAIEPDRKPLGLRDDHEPAQRSKREVEPDRLPAYTGVSVALIGVRDDALLWLDAAAGAFGRLISLRGRMAHRNAHTSWKQWKRPDDYWRRDRTKTGGGGMALIGIHAINLMPWLAASPVAVEFAPTKPERRSSS